MAEIVLGIATSHSPMTFIPGEYWAEHGSRDHGNRELVFPPQGISLSYEDALAGEYVPREVRSRVGTEEEFAEQAARCERALDILSETLITTDPDITVTISNDQDEWFFDGNMPAISVYWGKTAPIRPWPLRETASAAFKKYIPTGYGDLSFDVPVAAELGRHVIEHLMDHAFDVSHMRYSEQTYGGSITRCYPTKDGGELEFVRETPPRAHGLPHGHAFVVKRLFHNNPSAILPIFQNTCYQPNQVRPNRAYDFGVELRRALENWDSSARIAVVASGGLSHFVVDEELDRMVLQALETNNESTLRNLPRQRLYSAASETLNWVALGGVLAAGELTPEILDYVPVYRSEAGTGGGWAFVRWR